MIELKVYGSGCDKCRQLAENAEEAARRASLPYRLEKVTDTAAIIDAGVVRTPALAVDGVVRTAGKVASVDELAAILG